MFGALELDKTLHQIIERPADERTFHASAKCQPMSYPAQEFMDGGGRWLPTMQAAAKVAVTPFRTQRAQLFLVNNLSRLEVQQYGSMEGISSSMFERLQRAAIFDQMPQVTFPFLAHRAFAVQLQMLSTGDKLLKHRGTNRDRLCPLLRQ